MTTNTFNVVPASDKEYIDAFVKMGADGGLAFEKGTIGEFGEIPAANILEHEGIRDVLSFGVRVFPHLSFSFAGKMSVKIARASKADSLFDEVTVSCSDGSGRATPADFAKLVASVQKYLGRSSLLNIGNLLGPEVAKHFEAREIALARLEKMSSTLLEEMESARKQREHEFEAKEKTLEAKTEQKQRELDEAAKNRQQDQDRRAAQLEAIQKDLDDRAAKHARRQHYKDIKEKFQSWSETFQVTAGTKELRSIVFWFTLLLVALFGGLAAWFLFQSLIVQDSTLMVAAIVKQVAFTILFVSTAYFFIRWNDQWFQRHANEEFRLKRMELDIDRASWFVEMAFEWKDEKSEEIPVELIERLTQGLFSDNKGDHPVEPADSLAQALLGAARFKVKLADGTEAEYDRKSIEKLIRQSPSKRAGS